MRSIRKAFSCDTRCLYWNQLRYMNHVQDSIHKKRQDKAVVMSGGQSSLC